MFTGAEFERCEYTCIAIQVQRVWVQVYARTTELESESDVSQLFTQEAWTQTSTATLSGARPAHLVAQSAT